MKTKLLTLVMLAFLGLSTAKAQVGIGTENPENTAALDVEATDKGFLPPRMNTNQRDDIADPATGLAIYNTDANCVEFWGGYGWTSLCADVEPGDVLNTQTGRIWMDRNLGANQVAQSFDDPAAYGDLYQWGRAADGHEKIFRVAGDDPTSGTTGSQATTVLSDPIQAWYGSFIIGYNDWVNPSADNLWQGINGFNNPCPTGYRVPTEAEFTVERLSWSSNDRAGAFDSPLKLPVAGSRSRNDGDLLGVDTGGRYWSSSVSGSDARRLFFSLANAGMVDSDRAVGRSVRCIKGEE